MSATGQVVTDSCPDNSQTNSRYGDPSCTKCEEPITDAVVHSEKVCWHVRCWQNEMMARLLIVLFTSGKDQGRFNDQFNRQVPPEVLTSLRESDSGFPNPDELPLPHPQRTCSACGRTIHGLGVRLKTAPLGQPEHMVYCSWVCWRGYTNEQRRVEHEQRACEHCGEPFTPTRSDGRYCSNAHRQAAYRERQKVAITPKGP